MSTITLYKDLRSCPCSPGDDWPECSTHGIVARGGTVAEQLAAIAARDNKEDT
jgi:hypothetical protein